jgi:hypothetical protein
VKLHNGTERHHNNVIPPPTFKINMAEEDEDPFGAFGDDDEEDDDVEMEEDEATRIAKSLLMQANEKLKGGKTTVTTPAPESVSKSHLPYTTVQDMDVSQLKVLEISWPGPIFQGPILLVSSLPVGGGRGYVASRRLEPGTLVLVEEPMMKWASEQLGNKLDLVSVRRVLEHPEARKLVHDMEDFHPTKEDVDNGDQDENSEQVSGMMQTLRTECTEDQILELVQLAEDRSIQSRNSTLLASIDILRLLLSLRYNGLESGLYRQVAMLNHSCFPNCAKLLPSTDQSYSEVRTTRALAAGESLTISYLPRVMSHASRRKYLWDQHRFDIGANLTGEHLKMELVGNSLPSSSIQRWDDENLTHRIEKATEEIEKLHNECSSDITNGTAEPDVWEHVKALEVASLELYNESTHLLKSDRHIILTPCLSLHLEVCQLIRKAPLSQSTQVLILGRLVVTAQRLLILQEGYLGPDHFDLARTNLDFAEAVSELLSRSPRTLFSLDLPKLKTFEAWSTVEHQSRKEHTRIRALYPHDAEDSFGSKR